MLMVFSESQPFSSNFRNGEITRSAFIAKQIRRKCIAWSTWTSVAVLPELHSVFHVLFLLVALHSLTGIKQVIYRWKAAINTQLFRVDHFFILATVLKVFLVKFIQCSSWTSCCFHVGLLWHIFVCNFPIHFRQCYTNDILFVQTSLTIFF